MTPRHLTELSAVDRDRLARRHPHACHAYDRYRDRGYTIRAAFRFALAWGRNVTEQRARRLDHETGAVA